MYPRLIPESDARVKEKISGLERKVKQLPKFQRVSDSDPNLKKEYKNELQELQETAGTLRDKFDQEEEIRSLEETLDKKLEEKK